MARLLECEGWVDPDSLAVHLHHDLPDEYVVVADPTVRGHELDVVVVGPQGLFVVHDDGVGRPRATDAGETEGELKGDSGRTAWQNDSEERMTSATKALEAFLQDEFPSLAPELHHLRVVPEPRAYPERALADTIPTTTSASAAERISSTRMPEAGSIPDLDQRVELGVALRDRRLTATQRASEPFVFRSGHALGSGTEVWTIREAVRHMDADPESGIYHLRNDTLADWFHEQGAEHLAQLAQDVMRKDIDHRAALETFLIGTGLVSRPNLDLRPRRVNLGYTLAGEDVARRFRLRKGRGRGYLFGKLEPGVPWLAVYPREFESEGEWAEITVRAKTEGLPISQTPREEAIYVRSNASEEPVKIPVRLQVVGLPSALNRYVLRPGAGLITGGLLGAALGWLLTLQGVPAAGQLDRLAWLPVSPAAVWAAFIALVWAALGAIRGIAQPRPWPIPYTLGRWLTRLGVWAASLGLTGGAARWAWGGLRATSAEPVPTVVTWVMVLGPAAAAVVPATIGEMRSGRRMRETSARAIRWTFLRPLLLPAGAFVLALAVRLGAPRLRPLWQQLDAEATIETVREWIAKRLVQLETAIQSLIDDLYMRYYESR